MGVLRKNTLNKLALMGLHPGQSLANVRQTTETLNDTSTRIDSLLGWLHHADRVRLVKDVSFVRVWNGQALVSGSLSSGSAYCFHSRLRWSP